jgi:hypothetical protein
MAAWTAWVRHHPRIFITRYWHQLLLFVVLIIAMCAGFFEHPSFTPVLVLVVVAAALIIPNVLLAWWAWHRKFKALGVSGADVSYTVDDRGVTLSLRGNAKVYLWPGFSRIYESRRTVILEVDPGDFLYIPKRSTSAAQLSELKRLATAGALDCKVSLAAPFA